MPASPRKLKSGFRRGNRPAANARVFHPPFTCAECDGRIAEGNFRFLHCAIWPMENHLNSTRTIGRERC